MNNYIYPRGCERITNMGGGGNHEETVDGLLGDVSGDNHDGAGFRRNTIV